MDDRHPSRLPNLGSRGQGWVVLQGILFVACAAAATWGPPWPPGIADGLRVAGVAVALAGGALAVGALANLGKSLTALPKPLDGAQMKTTGVYALVRHPIYGGLLLLAFGGSLATAPVALIPTIGLALLFEGKRRVEERWLSAHYAGYAEYARQVRRAFIPFVW